MGMIEILFDTTCAMFQTGKINSGHGYSSLDDIPDRMENSVDEEMVAKVEDGLKKKARNNCGKSGLTKEKMEKQGRRDNSKEKSR